MTFFNKLVNNAISNVPNSKYAAITSLYTIVHEVKEHMKKMGYSDSNAMNWGIISLEMNVNNVASLLEEEMTVG